MGLLVGPDDGLTVQPAVDPHPGPHANVIAALAERLHGVLPHPSLTNDVEHIVITHLQGVQNLSDLFHKSLPPNKP